MRRHPFHYTPWVFLVMGSHVMAMDPPPDAAANAPPVEQGAQDPFATVQQTDQVAQPDNGVATSTDASDPFASDNGSSRKRAAPSRFTLQPVNFIYQGSYIPNVISDQNRDFTLNTIFLDGTAHWAPIDSAMLKARVLLQGDVEEAQSQVSRRGEATGLEYFYEQRFDDQSQALTVGRKYLGWSSGFQWRPADLIDNGFTTKNVEIEDPNRYLGVNQVSYELNRAHFNIDAVVSNRDRRFYDGLQSALKVGFSGPVDLSVLFSRNGDYSKKYGVILDTALPWSTTLRLEAVHTDVNKTLMYDSLHFGKTLESLTGVSRFQDVYARLTKFIDDKRRVDLEFLYDGNGFRDDSAAVRSAALGSSQAAAGGGIQVDPTLFANQYIGRYYSYAAYTGYIEGWRLEWKPSLLMNLGDHSYIGSISIEREFFGTSLTLALSSYHGGDGTEFGSISHGVGVSVSYVVPIL